MAKVLIVDDQPMVLKCLKSALTADGHDIATVSAGDMALRLVGFQNFDIIITDYAMPGMDGIKFLEIARERSPGVPVIMITGYGTADTAMDAMNKGAFDYLAKPFSLDALRSTVGAALEYITARNSIPAMGHVDPAKIPYCNLIAASHEMIDLCNRIADLSKREETLLIQGEHGTEKEIVARTLHANGPRRDEFFERIDCSRMKEGGSIGELIAFSKAATMYFHEINKMPESLQKELVGILLTKRYYPTENGEPAQLNTRILLSTSVRLEQLVADNKFNGELFRAVENIRITIPPLRDRIEDLRIYIGILLRQMCNVSGDIPIEPEALLMLEKYPWPGNIPELEETLRNASTMAAGNKIGIQHLPRAIVRTAGPQEKGSAEHADLKQFRGQVVKSFLSNMKEEYKTLIDKIESFAE